MSSINIHGADYAIRKIFSDDFVFTIPLYQRPYSWTIEEAGELLEDLIAYMGDGKESLDDLMPYFLGSIVLIKGDKPDAQVVDGQQRLTTLAILLAALRALMNPTFGKDLTPFLVEKGNAIANVPNRYRLTLRDRDANFFQEYVQDEGGIEKLKELNATLPSESQTNIKENALLFLQRLEELSEDQRLHLAQFIVSRCFLVVVSTPDLESAYRIFSVLNDRGLTLSYSDILKAEITGKVPSALQENYTSKWEDLETLLGIEAFQTLFINIRTIYCKTPLRKTVLEEFRKYVYPAGRTNITPQEFIDNTLCPYTHVLNTILKANYQSERYAKEINSLLKWLNLLSNGDWMPVAMLYLRQNWHNPDALLRFFTNLERLAASFMVLRVPRYRRVNRYNALLVAIDQKEILYTHYSPLQLTYDERRATYNALNGSIYQAYGINRVCRYVLLRLDAILSEGIASYEYSTITIEHILPQHPTSNSDWMKHFPTKEVREKYIHRLGNLVLLSRSKNKDASNYDFIQKKQKYFASYRGISPFVLTSQVLQQLDWTPAIIEQRQSMLMNRLCLEWGLLSS